MGLDGARIDVEAVKDSNKKEELITMSKEDLETLIQNVVGEFNKRIDNTEDRIERMKVMYEKQDAEHYLKNRGDFADKNLEIVQLGMLSPLDNETALDKKYRELHGMGNETVTRFVNKHESVRPLRQSQGWRPVYDENNNEVRDVDMVLMSMPRKQYDETVGAQKKAKKDFRKRARAIAEGFHERGKERGIETFGSIRFDKTDNYEGE